MVQSHLRTPLNHIVQRHGTLNMLKIFGAMEVPKNHWVQLSSCMSEDEVDFWWEAAHALICRKNPRDNTWVEFIETFNVTYYLEQVREHESHEFYNLIQREMLVREYEKKIHPTGKVCTWSLYYRKSKGQ